MFIYLLCYYYYYYYHFYDYYLLSWLFIITISYYPRPSKGQVKLGRYTNSRPLPKDHRKLMVFIYINLYNGFVDLGNLGIYVYNIYKGKPAKPNINSTASATTAAHPPISSL